jgi:hypothetical protein
MEGIWIAVSFIFVFGTLAAMTFAIGRAFGGWHRHARSRFRTVPDGGLTALCDGSRYASIAPVRRGGRGGN